MDPRSRIDLSLSPAESRAWAPALRQQASRARTRSFPGAPRSLVGLAVELRASRRRATSRLLSRRVSSPLVAGPLLCLELVGLQHLLISLDTSP
jgi:hypothetical protein